MKKLNVNQLKYLAAFFMILDSAYLAMPLVFPEWFHLITRFVAPLFGFFLVEGFFHTGNRKKYLSRLFIAAVLMQSGDVLSFLLWGRKCITDNIFLTLTVGFLLMYTLEYAKKKSGIAKVFFSFTGLLIYLAGAVFSFIPITIGSYSFGLEGGVQVLSVIGTFYLFYGNRTRQILAFLCWNILFILLTGIPLPWDYDSISSWFSDLCFNSENLTFLFLPFVFLYNGEKGRKSAFNRYFFYVLYPAHLWILYGIAAVLFP